MKIVSGGRRKAASMAAAEMMTVGVVAKRVAAAADITETKTKEVSAIPNLRTN